MPKAASRFSSIPMTAAFAAALSPPPRRERRPCTPPFRRRGWICWSCPPKTISPMPCCVSPTCASTALILRRWRHERLSVASELGRAGGVCAQDRLYLAKFSVGPAVRAGGGGDLCPAAAAAQERLAALRQSGAGQAGDGRAGLAAACPAGADAGGAGAFDRRHGAADRRGQPAVHPRHRHA